jgi:bacillolysin
MRLQPTSILLTALRRPGLLLPVAAMIVAAFSAPLVHAAGARASDVDEAVRAMTSAAGEAIAVTRSSATGTIAFLAAPAPGVIPISDPAALTPEARALSFVSRYAKAFGIAADSRLAVTKVAEADSVGMDHVRLQQLHRGVPVTGAEMTVHLRGAGVVSVLAKTLPDLSGLDVTPRLDAATAGGAARNEVGGLSTATNIRLEVLNRGLLEGGLGVTRLAWFVEVVGAGLREYVWIDARRGIVLLRFSQLAEAKARQVYTASNGSVLPGLTLRSEGQPATGDPDADAAYDFSGDTYDYFLTRHGRDSFDGAGAAIVSTVHFCPKPDQCPYPNAAWTGSQMIYGEGFSRADDVDAHELTHALTERTANLFYYMQSGALNESISDFFGEAVDLTNGKGNDGADVRWLLGEDVPGFGAFRNMMGPNQFGQPDRVYGAGFFCGRADGGGVHTNSGVPNHALAMMVDGATFNQKTISGIGLAKVEKVVYRALTSYLTSASGMTEFYDAMKQSCADLVGSPIGLTSSDCEQVQQAMDAVDMPNWNCGWRAAKPSTCGLIGDVEVPVFTDDLENPSSGNWTTGGGYWTGGAGYPDIYWTGFSTSGLWSFWGFAPPVPSDSWVAMTRSVLIPSRARLRFSHSFNFEPLYDGGIVQYTADEGASWHDVTTYDGNAAVPYFAPLPTQGGNPLQTHQAFTGNSYGYTASQVFLDSFQGQKLRFRFRIGTDRVVGDIGWFIDDVHLYNCETPPAVTVDNVTVQEGNVGTVPAVFTVTLSKPFPLPLTYAYKTESIQAIAGEDFVASSGTLVFPPGATSRSVSVPVIGDLDFEPSIEGELFSLVVASPTFGGGGGGGTIVDDDLAFAGATISDVTLAEPRTGTSHATFTVKIPNVGQTRTLGFRTVDGTAVAPADYTAVSGTLTFEHDASNQVTQLPLSIPVKASASTTSPRSFYVDLSDFTDPYYPIGRSRGTATIYEPGLYPLTPCRLLDTRERDQGPALSAGSTRTVVVGGQCGIPPRATAVSLNVTVVSPTAPGALRIFVSGPAPLVSAINYVPGQTRANNAVVPLSDRGWLSILCDQAAGVVDVIVDVNGFVQ